MEDLKGRRFNRFKVLEYVGGTRWRCRCSCGTEKVVLRQALVEGRQKSCGCLRREKTIERSTTHGMSHRPEYGIWLHMKDRCQSKSDKGYKLYGARGIKICEHWQSFEKFYEDMGPRPSLKHSLERKDNDGDYCPENCVWATQKEQCNNRRGNVLLELDGRTQTLKQWTEERGLPYPRVYARLKRGGTPERALS